MLPKFKLPKTVSKSDDTFCFCNAGPDFEMVQELSKVHLLIWLRLFIKIYTIQAHKMFIWYREFALFAPIT